jgi:hypothetical protein
MISVCCENPEESTSFVWIRRRFIVIIIFVFVAVTLGAHFPTCYISLELHVDWKLVQDRKGLKALR